MTMTFGLSLLLSLAQAGPLVPTVAVKLGASNVSIGERFQVSVAAQGPSRAKYEFPKRVNNGSVELTQSRAATTATVAVYDAQVFAIGKEAEIPEIEVRFKLEDGADGSVKSAPVPLHVVSTLDPNDQNPAPADFAPPVPVLVSRAFWVASAFAGVSLIVGLVLLIRKLRFPKKLADPTIMVAISPEEHALAGLEALGKGAPEPRAFYIRLIQILKQYLERRLEAPVLEMTSTETMALVKTNTWTAPHSVALRDLVVSADLVKFGGSSQVPDRDQQIQLVRDVVGRIDRLHRADMEMEARETARRQTAS